MVLCTECKKMVAETSGPVIYKCKTLNKRETDPTKNRKCRDYDATWEIMLKYRNWENHADNIPVV